MASLSLRQVTVRFPTASEPALDEVDLEVPHGHFAVVCGPERSGKSTLLRVAGGQEEASSGSVWIGGEDVTARSAQDRGAVLVMQHYALYPHLSVQENMAFALRVAGVAETELQERVRYAAEVLELTGALDLHPDQITGPQRQQVALARAMVRRPTVLLMDDPLVALSPELVDATAELIGTLARHLDVTTLMACTDPAPVWAAADTLWTLDHGRLHPGTNDHREDRP